tara:strand:- start:699 stop:1226 length:528 start_codon:yes stop_codon:yes gene_type:complete
MNLSKPIFTGLSAAFVIGVLALLTFESPYGVWLMFSFGSSALILFVYYDSEFARAKNVFFGHLISIIIGILFNHFIGISFISLGLSVGVCITAMMYLKIVHPPAAANPLIALFADVSYDFILFPVMSGSLTLILLAYLINTFILGRTTIVKKSNLKVRLKSSKLRRKKTKKNKVS